MKFIDEYRDPALIRGLLAAIEKEAAAVGRDITLMEVCGTHTHAIGRHGLKRLLPANLRLISGPGCPVCVTSVADVDRALHLAGRGNVTFLTFGDMMRVPGTGGRSLRELRAGGADVRVVSSAARAADIALENPGREVVLMGIGFETTAPTVASAVLGWRKKRLENVSLFSVHKLIGPALQALTGDKALGIDGFICPGHVSTITGTGAYRSLPEAGRAAVITGFEPVDILEGVLMALNQISSGRPRIEVQYARAVHDNGNFRAREVMHSVFRPADAQWRGLGAIPASGLVLRKEFSGFDACARFEIPPLQPEDTEGCLCGEVLRGVREPADCPLFRKGCTPARPAGPCMVSSEGICAAHFKYGG